MAKADADLELSNMKCVKLERREKQKEDKVAKLKKVSEELKAKYLVLETEKASVKFKLEQTQVDTLQMLGETFEQAIRQAHLLYKGSPSEGTFNINKDIFEGRLVPFDELVVLQNLAPKTTAEDVEDEDH